MLQSMKVPVTRNVPLIILAVVQVTENAVNVKTLKRCFNERIDRELGNFVDTVEDKIQNAILTAIAITITPKIELAIRSMSASSLRDATSVMANSERGEHIGIVPF